jgi:uncharacterized protein
MMNLRYFDKDTKDGNTYRYVIKPFEPPGSYFPAELVVLHDLKGTDLFEQPKLFTGQGLDKKALLSWSVAETGDQYASYNVFRRKDGSNDVIKVNAQPILPTEDPSDKLQGMLYYVDSTGQNVKYIYYVVGHSPFGIEGPPSQEIDVECKEGPLAATIDVQNVEPTATGPIHIHWTFPSNLENKITGFNVYCSKTGGDSSQMVKLNGGLLTKSGRKFTHNNPNPSNYYIIEAVDVNGHFIRSQIALGQKADDGPPQPPTNLKGEPLSKDGWVRLTWDASPSTDVMGYRVFVADQQNGDYFQITSTWIKEQILEYKLDPKTIAEAKYFKVCAVDTRENLSSIATAQSVAVKIPDIIPPSRSVITLAEPRSNGNYIEYKRSESVDVVSVDVMRRKKNDLVWESVHAINIKTTNVSGSFLDEQVEANYTYEYTLTAKDDAGLESNSNIHAVKSLVTGTRKGVTDFDADFVKSDEGVELTWEYNNEFGVDVFLIFRKLSNASPDQLQWTEVASVRKEDVMVGGQYNGPAPVTNIPGNGGDPGQYQPAANPGQFAKGVNFNQPGSTEVHDIEYKYVDRNFQPFVNYDYSVSIRFVDGTTSLFAPKKTIKTY